MQKQTKTGFKIMAPIHRSENDKFDNANKDLGLIDVSLDRQWHGSRVRVLTGTGPGSHIWDP